MPDIFLRANTAQIVTVGPFYDKTDGVTIENSLTITNERITMVLDNNDGSAPSIILDNVTGATSGTDNDLNYITNCDAGLMQLELSAANTNYAGRRGYLTITDAANHVPVFHSIHILAANVFDSLGGSDYLQVDVEQLDGDGTAAANLNTACDNYSATRGLTGTALPAAAADAAGGVPISDAGGLDIDAKLANTNEVTAARMGALTDLIDGGRLDLLIDAIKAMTDKIGTVTNTGGTATIGAILGDFANSALASRVSDARMGALTDWINGGRLDLILDDIVADTNELQTDDTPGAIAALDSKIDTIDGIVDSILVDTGTTLDGKVDSILADTGTDGVVVAAGSKTGYALAAGATAIAHITLIERIYQMINNRMAVTEADGNVALRNIGNTADIATGNVASSSGTTTRAELSWS